MYYVSESKVTVANTMPIGVSSAYMDKIGGVMTKPDQINSDQTHKTYTHKPESGTETIESRFGKIAIDKAKAILFPVGLLGMPEKNNFGLTGFPNPKLQQFKLLQSLDDHALSFITLPLELENSIIDREDIVAAAADMEIPLTQLGIVLIVSVHRNASDVRLSVNARAPIFFDTARHIAAQYVFTSNKYAVQHYITGDKAASAN